MGTALLEKDWKNFTLGEPQHWPQHFCAALGLVLNSPAPMVLFWDDALTPFYNDAFDEQSGSDNEEVLHVLGGIVKRAYAAGPVKGTHTISLRTGTLSAALGAVPGGPGALAVITTAPEAQTSPPEIAPLEMLQHVPVAVAVFRGKDYRVQLANGQALLFWGKKEQEVLNKPVLEVMPELEGGDTKEMLDRVYTTGATVAARELQVRVIKNGTAENIFVNFVYNPLRNAAGEIEGIITVGYEVNAEVSARRKVEESEKRFRNMVMQAPVGIIIFQGPEFNVQVVNKAYLEIVDRAEPDFVGRPLFEVLPEVKEAVEPLLESVLTTGAPYYGTEFPVTLNRFGKQELTYFNFVYHPLREEENITGVIVVASEVTQSVLAKQRLAERETQFRNLIRHSPIPMAIFRGEDFVIEMANMIMFENVWRKTEEDVIGKKLLDVFPELKGQKYPKLLKRVFETGMPHSEKEAVAFVQHADSMKKFYLDYEYAPLRDTEGKVNGLIVTVNDVTQKVEARIRVEDSEREYKDIAERLNIVIDASELGTWEWDLETNQIKYSDRYLEIFGMSHGISTNHETHLAMIHPDDLEFRNDQFRAAMETGVLAYEARILWPDGSIHWIEAKGKVFFDEKDVPMKLVGTVRDTTAGNKHQRELYEREMKFRLLADSMPQHIWTADPQGNLNYFNRSVFTYSGLTNEELNMGGWLQIVHPDDRDGNVREWMRAVETGNDFIYEHRFRRYDGEYRWQLSRAMPQKDAEGQIQMWVGTSTDIQDQKMFTSALESKVRERTRELDALNETLRKSEERYHLMVEEVQEYAIIYLNREGVVENWNKGAEKIKGYRADEIIGRHFRIFHPGEDRENGLPEKLLQQAVAAGKAIQEGRRIRKDGSAFWASVVITAVHDNEGNVIGFSKVTHDLSEKKAAQDAMRLNAEQIAQKNTELEKMNAELKSFAYVSSHDLQEPLRKIQTFASRILSKEMQQLSDNAKDYFRRMQDAANRMQTLIQDLLAYSKTSTTELVFEKTDLGALINEVVGEHKELLAEKHAILEVSGTAQAKLIPFQCRQLLTNLLANALKFARPGVAPHIRIICETGKGSKFGNDRLSPGAMYCHIRFSDNGIGFDPQYSERIFQVFQRLHGKEEYSGTGIGLAIVKKIVENHSGVITATGAVGEGATFDIFLPMR